MKILALEFSSAQRSVALVEVDLPSGAGLISESIETGDTATRTIELVQTVLREAKLRREHVQAVAVGLGPGSYTGVRAALAFAQGWHLARGVPVFGISSAECLAWEAHSHGLAGPAHVVLDALRGEFYLATYELSPAGVREIEPLRLAALEEVRSREQAGGFLIGPEIHRWFPAGRQLFPRAAILGNLAATRSPAPSVSELEPLYLRQTAYRKVDPAKPAAP
jgi:tRNA threonylcarbamoyladenosine biosynthesis protein TsaB